MSHFVPPTHYEFPNQSQMIAKELPSLGTSEIILGWCIARQPMRRFAKRAQLWCQQRAEWTRVHSRTNLLQISIRWMKRQNSINQRNTTMTTRLQSKSLKTLLPDRSSTLQETVITSDVFLRLCSIVVRNALHNYVEMVKVRLKKRSDQETLEIFLPPCSWLLITLKFYEKPLTPLAWATEVLSIHPQEFRTK